MIKGITKDFLIKEYNKKSVPKIARELDCSVVPIYKRLRLYNIPIKNRTHYRHTQETKNLMRQLAKKRIGLNASNFKDGRYCNFKNYYCIICGNRISVETWYFGSKKCRKCGNKGINKGNKNGMFGKSTPHGKWGIYKGIKMRSSYEIAYAKWLDKHNIIWTYESKVFDLGNSTYRPDFYLPEIDEYIEIKGWWRDNAKRKFKLFKKLYPKIKIKVLNREKLQKFIINI